MEQSNVTAAEDRRSLLIVDDDRDFAASLLDVVEHLGYQATVANSARDARQVLEARRVGVVLVDIRLRQSNGIELVRELRSIQPGVLCVMMTAYATTETAIAALHHGAYDFLRKPFHPDELLATLRRAFDRLDLERENAESDRALQRYRQIVSSTSDLMGFIDNRFRYRAVNDAYLHAYDVAREAIVGQRVSDVHGMSAFETQLQPALERCLKGEEVRVQTWFDFPNRGRQFIDAAFFPHRAEEPDEAGVVVSLRDLTETQRLSEQISYEASHDALTGLVNRREFEVRLQRLIDLARTEDIEHAFCYFDLDQFKVVNDTCGHVAGDELLRQISSILPREIRSGDTFARLGGDEFGVLMQGCSIEQAARVASALLEALRKVNFRWEGKSFSVGASIGLIPITHDSESTTNVLSLADRACYAAKDAGRNRIQIYREDDAELARSHGEMQWVSRLKRALDDGRFVLHCQPIFALDRSAERQESLELLVRMVDEGGKLVLPGAFLPAAERYNLASRLDRWVCDAAFDWIRANAARVARLDMISINLSASSLADEALCEHLFRTLHDDDDLARKVCLEITETAAIMNLSRAMTFMEKLKTCGCAFALDDFGSGFSSFAYLRTLPVDYLKIDGQFVKDIAQDPVDFTMVRAINEVGQVMSKRTIAEFVESQAILERLRELGVDFAQGHHLGRPRPLD